MIDVFYKKATRPKLTCEDYAVGSSALSAYGFGKAVLCDGCSSAKNTDVGARVLAHSIFLGVCLCPEDIMIHNPMNDIQKAKSIIETLHLDQEALLCTVLILREYKDSYIVNMFGDGCIAVENEDNSFELFEVKYTEGAPIYPAYDLVEIETLKEMFPNQKLICQAISSTGVDKTYDFGQKNAFHMKFDREKTKKIAIFSDGLSSFEETPLDLVKEICAIPVETKNFLKRKCSRILKDRKHMDDFSCAMIINEKISR